MTDKQQTNPMPAPKYTTGKPVRYEGKVWKIGAIYPDEEGLTPLGSWHVYELSREYGTMRRVVHSAYEFELDKENQADVILMCPCCQKILLHIGKSFTDGVEQKDMADCPDQQTCPHCEALILKPAQVFQTICS